MGRWLVSCVWYACVILRVRAISLREASRAANVTLVGETCENDGEEG